MMGSFFLRSQTTQRDAKVEARMCGTLRFQARHVTSSAGCDSEPGVIGVAGLFRSQM